MILRFVRAIYEQFWPNSFGSSLIINSKRLDIKSLIALEKRLMEANRMGSSAFGIDAFKKSYQQKKEDRLLFQKSGLSHFSLSKC